MSQARFRAEILAGCGMAALAMLLLLTGCGGTEPSEHGPAGTLRVVSGDGQTDTVEAVLPQLATVEVRNSSGQPVPGAEVVFGLPDCLCAVGARADASEPFMASATVSTNSQGRASAEIRLLSAPSVARFAVTAPALELSDTFEFTVLPGNGVQVYIQQRDTAVYAGQSYVASAAVLDRFGNPRADPVTLRTLDPAILELSADDRLTGRAYGVARIFANGAGLVDQTTVSVLPEGTIAVGLYASPSNVAVAGLDGSGFHTIVESGTYGGGAPSWSPDGQLLAYQFSGSAGSPSLWVTDLAGNARKLISQHPGSFSEEGFPRFSRDGVWIYFQGILFSINPGEIWRIHPDGTGLEMVGQPGSSAEADYYPDPSPDGTKVVFASTRGQQGFRIRVRTLATGAEQDLGVLGLVPRWSPAGDWIAYHGVPDAGDGGVYVIRPDGTEGHSISDGRSYDLESVEWSPDGAWVLARTPGGLQLVGVSDTLSLPIPSSTYWMFPSWLR